MRRASTKPENANSVNSFSRMKPTESFTSDLSACTCATSRARVAPRPSTGAVAGRAAGPPGRETGGRELIHPPKTCCLDYRRAPGDHRRGATLRDELGVGRPPGCLPRLALQRPQDFLDGSRELRIA